MSAYVSIRQHTSYVSIRQHAHAYVSIRQHTHANVSIRQHTSAYVSIRQHTHAYVSIRQHTSAYVSVCTCVSSPRANMKRIPNPPHAPRPRLSPRYLPCHLQQKKKRQHTSAYAYVSIHQHTSAYVSICIRQYTSANVSIRQHSSPPRPTLSLRNFLCHLLPR
jgi:hypothetical protein